jgi:butyrate kinase
MSKKCFRVLAINPGSTSTKAAVYDDEQEIANVTIRYRPEDLAKYDSIIAQREFRTNDVINMLEEKSIALDSLDAVVGRGGLVKPIDSGTYLINERMLEDLMSASATVHASALGGLTAEAIGRQHKIPAYVVDPVVVDEMEPCAKLTGIPGIERRSVFHALNSKAVARRCAKQIGIPYEDGRFIVAHMGGGITVGAHRYGRVIDVNDAVSGEGPFTPERSGSVPLEPVIDLCFSGKFTKAEILSKLIGKGGMQAYLGTTDMLEAAQMVKGGDEYAALVIDSMAYQVSKEIGAMAAVLEGRINAIILTGGLAYSVRFTGSIKQRVDQIAQVYTFPGEAELLALVEGALRVLKSEAMAATYL